MGDESSKLKVQTAEFKAESSKRGDNGVKKVNKAKSYNEKEVGIYSPASRLAIPITSSESQ